MADQKFMDPAKLRTSQALRKRVEAYLKNATDLTPEQAEAVRRYALGELPFRAHTQKDAIIRSDFASDIARHVYNIRPWTADEARTYKASPPGAVGTAPISFKGADGKEFLIPEYGKPGSFKADVASWLRAGSKYHDPESTWNSVAQADRDAFLKEYEDEVKAADSAVKMMDPKSLGDPAYGGAAPAGVDAGPPPMQLIGMPPSYGGASGRFPRARESPQERMRRRFEEELSQLSEADQAMRRGVAPGGVRFDNVAGIPTPRGSLSADQREGFISWVRETFGDEKADKVAGKLVPPSERPGGAVDVAAEDRLRKAKLYAQAAGEHAENAGMLQQGYGRVASDPALKDRSTILAEQQARRLAEEESRDRAQRADLFGNPGASMEGLQSLEERRRRSGVNGAFTLTTPNLGVGGLPEAEFQKRRVALGLPDPAAQFPKKAKAPAGAAVETPYTAPDSVLRGLTPAGETAEQAAARRDGLAADLMDNWMKIPRAQESDEEAKARRDKLAEGLMGDWMKINRTTQEVPGAFVAPGQQVAVPFGFGGRTQAAEIGPGFGAGDTVPTVGGVDMPATGVAVPRSGGFRMGVPQIGPQTGPAGFGMAGTAGRPAWRMGPGDEGGGIGGSPVPDLAGALPAPSQGGRLENWRKLNEARRLRGEPPLPAPAGPPPDAVPDVHRSGDDKKPSPAPDLGPAMALGHAAWGALGVPGEVASGGGPAGIDWDSPNDDTVHGPPAPGMLRFMNQSMPSEYIRKSNDYGLTYPGGGTTRVFGAKYSPFNDPAFEGQFHGPPKPEMTGQTWKNPKSWGVTTPMGTWDPQDDSDNSPFNDPRWTGFADLAGTLPPPVAIPQVGGGIGGVMGLAPLAGRRPVFGR